MKILIVLLFLFSSIINIYGQRIIKGRVIHEELEVAPESGIYDEDTVMIGETDLDGYFEINIPEKSNKLNFGWIGCELATLTISSDCQYLEVILMLDYIYEYNSSIKIDRFRRNRFNKLPELHSIAVQKGLFLNKANCYECKYNSIIYGKKDVVAGQEFDHYMKYFKVLIE